MMIIRDQVYLICSDKEVGEALEAGAVTVRG
jgi:hypothetical protein